MRQSDLETPELRLVPVNGLSLAVWDWPGRDPPILFAHATGFHGRCWDGIARRFPGRRRIAPDFRGHGRSGKPEPPYPWRNFALDLASVAQLLEIEGAIGAGHSMGGHSIAAAAILRPEMFSALVLVDPTIFPRQYYGSGPFDTSYVQRRRNQWDSPQDMFERLRSRPPFARWQPEALQDYCEFGLVPEDGRFVLACPPHIEASIYPLCLAPESDLYDGIPSVSQPVLVMRGSGALTPGTLDLSASPTAPDLAAKFQRGRDLLLPDRSHYIPMEAPEVVAEAIGGYL